MHNSLCHILTQYDVYCAVTLLAVNNCYALMQYTWQINFHK